MKQQDFSTGITVDATAQEAFNAINHVSKWWTENLEGSSQKLNDEFSVRFGNVHFSKQKLIEVVPGKKVVWLVTDSKLSFVKKQDEWTNTKIIFELAADDNKTRIHFTHEGLTPGVECFNDCSSVWSEYIQSLLKLIHTGKGEPTLKEV